MRTVSKWIHVLATPDASEHVVLFRPAIVRDDQRDRAADRLLGRPAEQPLGRAIPGRDATVEHLADDDVIGGVDDGGEQRSRDVVGECRPGWLIHVRPRPLEIISAVSCVGHDRLVRMGKSFPRRGRAPCEARQDARGFGSAGDDQGQVVPPLESAPVLSPLPQTTKVPVALLAYLYEVPEPVQPAGSVGGVVQERPADLVLRVRLLREQHGRQRARLAAAVGQFVAAEPLSGRPPQCAE